MFASLSIPLLILASAPSLGAPCPASREDLSIDVMEAERTFAVMDVESFKAALIRLKGQISCLQEPILPPLSARIHRVFALSAWLEERPDEIDAAFRAAKQADPQLTMGKELVLEGHPLAAKLEEIAPCAGPWVALPPVNGTLLVDGTPSNTMATDCPALVQVTDGVETVLWSTYAWRPDQVAGSIPAEILPVVAPVVVRREHHPGRLLAFGAVSAGALVGAAAVSVAALYAADHKPEDASPKEWVGSQNARRGVAVGLAATGLGFGAFAVLEGRW